MSDSIIYGKIEKCPKCGKPVKERVLPRYLFHYTKIDSLKKILPGKIGEDEYDIKIFLPNAKFLNDPSETLSLRNFYKKYLLDSNLISTNVEYFLTTFENISKESAEKIGQHYESIMNEFFREEENTEHKEYIFSLTSLKDSVAFWEKGYADKDGVAIEFDTLCFELLFKDFNDFFQPVKYISINEEYKCKTFKESCEMLNHCYNKETEDVHKSIYFVSKMIARIFKKYDWAYRDSLKYINKGEALILFNYLAAFFKNSPWEYQNEYRIVLSDDIPLKEYSTTNLKCDSEIIDVKDKQTEGKMLYLKNESVQDGFVKSITLGYGCKDECKLFMEEYLRNKGYKNIKVHKSTAFEEVCKGGGEK